jgi:hypothetical protein
MVLLALLVAAMALVWELDLQTAVPQVLMILTDDRGEGTCGASKPHEPKRA